MAAGKTAGQLYCITKVDIEEGFTPIHKYTINFDTMQVRTADKLYTIFVNGNECNICIHSKDDNFSLEVDRVVRPLTFDLVEENVIPMLEWLSDIL